MVHSQNRGPLYCLFVFHLYHLESILLTSYSYGEMVFFIDILLMKTFFRPRFERDSL